MTPNSQAPSFPFCAPSWKYPPLSSWGLVSPLPMGAVFCPHRIDVLRVWSKVPSHIHLLPFWQMQQVSSLSLLLNCEVFSLWHGSFLAFHQIYVVFYWAGHQLVPPIPCPAGGKVCVLGTDRVSAVLWCPHLGNSLTRKALCITLCILAKPFPSPLHLNFSFKDLKKQVRADGMDVLKGMGVESPPSAGSFILSMDHHINIPASSVVSDMGPMAVLQFLWVMVGRWCLGMGRVERKPVKGFKRRGCPNLPWEQV